MPRLRWLLLPAALLLYTCLSPVDSWIGDVPDDAFVYLVLARNLLAGHGFSFDTLQPTTGFHLPWLLLSCFPAAVGDLEWVVRVWILVYGLLTLFAAVLVARRAGILAGFLCASAGVGTYGLGMETGLVLCALWAWIATNENPRLALLSGFALGLCRIDAIVWLLAGRRLHGFMGGVLGILVTFAFDHVVTGEFVSTAAALKGSGDLADRLARLDPSTFWRHLPLLAIVGAGGIVIGQLRGVSRDGFLDRLCVAGAIYMALAFLTNNLVAPWYYTPFAWALAAAGASGWTSLGRVPVVLIGAAVFLQVAPLPGPGLHPTVREVAREIGAATGPADVLLAEDFPGMLSYWSERRIVPADGLAASPAWRRALERGEAWDAGLALGVTGYLVTRRHADRIDPPFLSYPPSPVPLAELNLQFEAHRFALYRR